MKAIAPTMGAAHEEEPSMHTTPTASATPRRSPQALLLAGMIDLAGSGRRPHPGAVRCGALCVPACTAMSANVSDDKSPGSARGARS